VNVVTTIELKRGSGRDLFIGEEKRANRINVELLLKCVASSKNKMITEENYLDKDKDDYRYKCL
jgi:hypothetical protein